MFYWDDWNRDHIAKHDVEVHEAEWVINHLQSPFPEAVGDDKYRVWGKTEKGRYLQVIFAYHPASAVDVLHLTLKELLELESVQEVIYVVHARDLTVAEKRRLTRRR